MTDFFKGITDWYLQNINYGSLIGLMAVESSFLPLPSELIIPPAAWKAASGELNIVLVVLCGTVGSVIGATFNYFLALLLGRPIVHRLAKSKFAKLLLIEETSIDKAEAYFNKYGRSATFIGRLVLGVRHLISIPAGLAKMPLFSFWLYTALGSALWCSFLAVLGYLLHGQKELIEKYSKEISWAFFILVVLVLAFVVFSLFRKSKKTVAAPPVEEKESEK